MDVRILARQGAIKRGRRSWGWAGVIPGAVALALLIFLPAFTNLIDAVTGLVGVPPAPAGSGSAGSLAVPRAVAAGSLGGSLACLIGIAAGWVLAGGRFHFLVFFLLCLPATIGESAAASAFGTTVGPHIEAAAPLSGFISFALFGAWRVIGPATVVATIIFERMGRSRVLDTLPPEHKLTVAWRRWRVFIGVCILAGVLTGLMGSGHIPLDSSAGGAVKLIGPAEPGWRNPTLQAATAWAALTWPLYIIATIVFLVFVLRLAGKTTRSSSA